MNLEIAIDGPSSGWRRMPTRTKTQQNDGRNKLLEAEQLTAPCSSGCLLLLRRNVSLKVKFSPSSFVWLFPPPCGCFSSSSPSTSDGWGPQGFFYFYSLSAHWVINLIKLKYSFKFIPTNADMTLKLTNRSGRQLRFYLIHSSRVDVQ